MTPLWIANNRLLALATVLDTADEEHVARGEPTYTQRYIKHPCGTPACALGHAKAAGISVGFEPTHKLGSAVLMGFSDWIGMFGGAGCNDAKTAKHAAAYIRAFVARRTK